MHECLTSVFSSCSCFRKALRCWGSVMLSQGSLQAQPASPTASARTGQQVPCRRARLEPRRRALPGPPSLTPTREPACLAASCRP